MEGSSDFYATVLGSATAGLIARVICHPIDTVKSRVQAGVPTGLRSIEGIRSLYKGVGAVVVGGVPGVCIYMTTYEVAKEKLSAFPAFSGSPFASYFAAGMIAEAICCVVFVPVDVIKERLQVDLPANYVHKGSSSKPVQRLEPRYKNTMDALLKISRQEGLRGVYKGYGATLLSYGPFSALYFFLYEVFKGKAVDRRIANCSTGSKLGEGTDVRTVDLPFTDTLACAATAGAVASAATNPLDLAKLRMQVERVTESAGSAGANGVTRVQRHGLGYFMWNVYAKDGLAGLFRGAWARVLFHTPSTAITMAVFESCRQWWRVQLQK